MSAEETRELAPIVEGEILGALYTTNDGVVSARGLTKALVSGAKANGVKVVSGTIPQSITFDKVSSRCYSSVMRTGHRTSRVPVYKNLPWV